MKHPRFEKFYQVRNEFYIWEKLQENINTTNNKKNWSPFDQYLVVLDTWKNFPFLNEWVMGCVLFDIYHQDLLSIKQKNLVSFDSRSTLLLTNLPDADNFLQLSVLFADETSSSYSEEDRVPSIVRNHKTSWGESPIL